ncbi:MAG TPA: hypothetical protein VFO11_00635, partial [Candidatus Polarisedimenticolaceae bacterium]|nr:hypothetical protein [Candidatus Polarisedimenticolaceae bacterium]
IKQLLAALAVAAAMSGAVALTEPVALGRCGDNRGDEVGRGKACSPPRCPPCYRTVCDPSFGRCPWRCEPIPDCVP